MHDGSHHEPTNDALVISCDDCAMQHTDACDDCLVSFILNREPGDAVVIDAGEARALRMLADAGLVSRTATREARRLIKPPRHLLVTNDFPPKVGGIQVYLWELWRRFDPLSFAVLTASSHPDAEAFDARLIRRGNQIQRVRSPVLLPTPGLVNDVRCLAAQIRAELVVIDPALPLALIGPFLGLPYAVVLHGAEIALPGRVPIARKLTTEVLSRSALAVCAGEYPADEARRLVAGHTRGQEGHPRIARRATGR